MSDMPPAGLDDGRVAAAARRIIARHRLHLADNSEDSQRLQAGRPLRAPDDLHGLRLALDGMGQAIEHVHRLLESREAVFLAALERIERNLAKLEGKVDALADEAVQAAARPALDVDTLMEGQRTATLAVMGEFGALMALGRTLLDEVRDVHAAATAGRAPAAEVPPGPARPGQGG